MSHGAVTASITWDNAYYNAAANFYYYNSGSLAPDSGTHAVTIVAWDDHYDKNKFNRIPAGDGAFIVKTAGGQIGRYGSFYLSYYDVKLLSNTVFAHPEPSDNYARVYQYDPLGLVNSTGYGMNTAWAANVFTAVASEQLSAVNTYTLAVDTSYEINIYTKEGATPLTGQLITTQSGTIYIPGYHTIKLTTPVPLLTGENVSAAIKYTTSDFLQIISCFEN